MASPFLFGNANHAALGTASGPADPNFPASFILDPTRPLLAWHTTNTASTDCVIDLGSSKSVGMLAVFYTNYPSVTFFGSNDSGFGTVLYNSGLVGIGQNMWNERFGVFKLVAPAITARYWLVRITGGATLDGQAYFSTGGVYIGSLLALPTETDASPGGLEWDEDHVADESVIEQRTASGASHRLTIGPAKTILSYSRIAHVSLTSPGSGDGLAAWRVIDHNMRNRAFLWALNYNNPAEVWMMRKTSASTWPISYPVSRSAMVLEECIGP
jgi:hypothetical protein